MTEQLINFIAKLAVVLGLIVAALALTGAGLFLYFIFWGFMK